MQRRAFVLLCALMWCASAHAAETAKPKIKSSKASSSASSSGASSTTPSYAHRDDVRAFAAEVASETGLPRTEVERWFAAARFQPKIVALMDRPLLEPPKWFEYAPSFLSQARIEGGVRYWRDNEEALARAEATYGVPAQIIVAIIGVETFYGRNTGGYRVIDALATLAFDYPRRAPFFKGELKEYVRLARDQGFSPLVPKGSFAGAMGMPQFMPGSYRRFAVDFDGDGHADLWRSNADVIGSVANYLARHDWQRGEPVLAPALVAPEARDTALRRLDGGISERRPLAAWQQDGVTLRDTTQEAGGDPVGLLLLEEAVAGGEAAQGRETARGGDAGVGAASLWIAYPNFYVITRYNKSRLYAAAVWALSERLRASK